MTTCVLAHTRLHEGIVRLWSGASRGRKIGTGAHLGQEPLGQEPIWDRSPFELMNTTLKTAHCTRTCVGQHVRWRQWIKGATPAIQVLDLLVHFPRRSICSRWLRNWECCSDVPFVGTLRSFVMCLQDSLVALVIIRIRSVDTVRDMRST